MLGYILCINLYILCRSQAKDIRTSVAERDDLKKVQEYSLNPSFKKPTFMRNINIRQHLPGTDVLLPCMASGIRPIHYTWAYNGQTIVGKKHRQKFTYNQSMLKIKRIRYSDLGVYTCTASNMYGNLSYAFDIQLKDKTKEPVFYDYKSMVRKRRVLAPTSQSIHFHCQAESRKEVHYIWLKDGKPFMHIKPGKNVKATDQDDRNNGDLVLNSLKLNDAGQYTCVAFNRYGNTSFTYELRILRKLSGGPPKVIPYTQPQRVFSTVGDNVSFECLEIISATIPDVRWFHLYNVNNRHELPILPKEIQWEHSIKNQEVTKTYISKYISTKQYSTFRLKATNGKPKNDYIFDDTDPSALRLTLNNLTIQDTGVYGCHVSNFEGSDYALFYLTVTGNNVENY